jgi:hypothetical protein
MLKKAASVILASLRGSAYAQKVRLASALAAALPGEKRVLARFGWAGENEAFLTILCRPNDEEITLYFSTHPCC